MISYELALGLSLVGILLLSGSLSLREIVFSQSGNWVLGGHDTHVPHWFIFPQIVGFFIYLLAAYAETNRIPFDMPEAETELVAGYHTEYSSMKFAMFFMAEYVNMFTVACLATLYSLADGTARIWDSFRPSGRHFCRWFTSQPKFSSLSFSIYGFVARCRASVMTSLWLSDGSFFCRWPLPTLLSPA